MRARIQALPSVSAARPPALDARRWMPGTAAQGPGREAYEETVKTHVSNILTKLGLADRTQAVLWAVRRGIGT